MDDEFIRLEENVVSRHFLRRTARAKERRLTRAFADVHNASFRVVKARKGPARFYVVRNDE